MPHPRLILTPARLAAVKQYIATNPQAAAYAAHLEAQGAHVLSTSPIPRPPANATDILSAARTVLTRTYVTSLLYRLTGNESYAARAVAEMLSYTAWANWDLDKHALDTGELCHAAAIGLDWCYEFLSQPAHAASLAAIVDGIVVKGLSAFRAAYEERDRYSWTCASSNWACVTNGGAGIAALGVAGEAGAPAWLSDLLVNATAGVRCSAAAPLLEQTGGGFANDGAWWEGPIYHGACVSKRVCNSVQHAVVDCVALDGGLCVDLGWRLTQHSPTPPTHHPPSHRLCIALFCALCLFSRDRHRRRVAVVASRGASSCLVPDARYGRSVEVLQLGRRVT